MALNHPNGRSHLYGKCVNIHSVIEKSKCRVGVTEAIKGSIEACAWAFNKPAFLHERTEGLMQVLILQFRLVIETLVNPRGF